MGGKGSGRPQKSAKLKLDFRVAVNFTEAEFDAIKKGAAARGSLNDGVLSQGDM